MVVRVVDFGRFSIGRLLFLFGDRRLRRLRLHVFFVLRIFGLIFNAVNTIQKITEVRGVIIQTLQEIPSCISLLLFLYDGNEGCCLGGRFAD